MGEMEVAGGGVEGGGVGHPGGAAGQVPEPAEGEDGRDVAFASGADSGVGQQGEGQAAGGAVLADPVEAADGDGGEGVLGHDGLQGPVEGDGLGVGGFGHAVAGGGAAPGGEFGRSGRRRLLLAHEGADFVEGDGYEFGPEAAAYGGGVVGAGDEPVGRGADLPDAFAGEAAVGVEGLGGTGDGGEGSGVVGGAEEVEAALAAEQDQFQVFFQEDPARFYLPDGDERFFDDVFAALEQAEQTPMRIVHYGDSQIEEDRITGAIRERLQERFGGNGPGLMPGRKLSTPHMSGSSSAKLRRFFNYGGASNRASGRLYGPFADFVRLDTVTTFSFRSVTRKDQRPSSFERVTLLVGNVKNKMSASSQGDQRRVEADSAPLSFLRYELPDSSTRVSLTASGYADLYGILLDSKTGVRMDNVPMRGCSGTIFTSMDAAQLRQFYQEENVRLILLQYGGNSVPYLKTDKVISNYKENIRKQIRFVQELAPKAKIIFIGPSDMATTVNGKRQTYPKLANVVDSLRAAATECGAAYWDIYGVMGGENAMVQWVTARPPLAGPDYVHFTLAGAKKVGDMFSDAFFLYYEYYRWRKKNGR